MKITNFISGRKISNDQYWVQPLKVDTGNRLTASDGGAGVLLFTGGPAGNFGLADREQREDSALHQKGIHNMAPRMAASASRR